jgi:hypothetical protein
MSGFFNSGVDSSGNATTNKYTPQQSALLQSLISKYAGYGSGQSVATYGGQLTAPMSTGQNQSLQGLMTLNQPSQLGSTTTDALQGIISGSTEAASADAQRKLFDTNVEAPLLKTYKENFQPNLDSYFAAKGLAYGSDKQNAQETEANNLMGTLTQGRSTMEANILQNLVSNQVAGIGASNQTQNQSLQNLLGLGSAGAQEQQTQQASDTAQYNQWLRNQPGTNPAEQQIMQLLGLNPVTTQQTSGSQTNAPSDYSNFSSVLGTVGGLAAITAMLF